MEGKRKKCVYCGAEAIWEAKQCSNCGYVFGSTKAPKGFEPVAGAPKQSPLRTGCAGLGALLFLFWIVGALSNTGTSTSYTPPSTSSTNKSSSPPVAPAPPPEPRELVLKPDWKFEVGEFGISKIRGTVVNKTGRNLAYAQIQFNIYDASGAQVESTFANINNLEAGGIWKFEASGFKSGDGLQAKFAGFSSW